MLQPTGTEQIEPMTRREAATTMRRLQEEAARRSEGVSDQEKDAFADEAARELKDGLNARLGVHP